MPLPFCRPWPNFDSSYFSLIFVCCFDSSSIFVRSPARKQLMEQDVPCKVTCYGKSRCSQLGWESIKYYLSSIVSSFNPVSVLCVHSLGDFCMVAPITTIFFSNAKLQHPLLCLSYQSSLQFLISLLSLSYKSSLQFLTFLLLCSLYYYNW